MNLSVYLLFFERAPVKRVRRLKCLELALSNVKGKDNTHPHSEPACPIQHLWHRINRCIGNNNIELPI